MLQDDFQYGTGQFRPQSLTGHKLLVYKTDLDRASANIKTQDSFRALPDRLTHDLQDVVAMSLEWVDSVPRRCADIRHTDQGDNYDGGD